MNKEITHEIYSMLDRFINWLEKYGETSQDQYDFWANPLGQKTKSIFYANPLLGAAFVTPFIFFDAVMPASRKLFWHKQRFPIADAHYTMGFSKLHKATGNLKAYNIALNFLDVLKKTNCPGYQYHCWGYPFDWVTKTGLIKAQTPLITTTPYVYEAFADLYDIDRADKHVEIMLSIAKHALNDIKDSRISPEASAASYTPFDRGRVINASAYRAFLLTDAAIRFKNDKFWQVAKRNLNFVLNSQKPDGSWFYAEDGKNHFIDHFHTCFVLKNLAKIEQQTGYQECAQAIERGLAFYLSKLIDKNGLPIPFASTSHITLYKRELYDYAESINLALMLRRRYVELDNILKSIFEDLEIRWQKPDGSFRTRQLFLGWNNVPYHRWAQAQIFRSLCCWYYKNKQGLEGITQNGG